MIINCSLQSLNVLASIDLNGTVISALSSAGIFAFGFISCDIFKRISKPIKNKQDDDISINQQNNIILESSNTLYYLWPEDDDGISTDNVLKYSTEKVESRISKMLDCDCNEVFKCILSCHEEIAKSINSLRNDGKEFVQIYRNIAITGKIVGARALLELRPNAINYGIKATKNFNIPIWKSDFEGNLAWCNDAYLHAVEKTSLKEAIEEDIRLDDKEKQDTLLAIKSKEVVDTRAISIDGQRRMTRIIIAPAFDGALGLAIDIEDEYQSQEILQREAKAHEETLDQLNDAVAVFDNSRRLITYNQAFARLWNFTENFLDEKPTHDEILDKLREKSKIPHQINFTNWKKREMEHYTSLANIPDETWTLPDGRFFRVMRQRQPIGGLLILFEDISDKTSLQAQYKTQIDVQKATLNGLGEGIAVFSSNGKITLANNSFKKLWNIDQKTIDDTPELDKLTKYFRILYDKDSFWDNLLDRICDPSANGRMEANGKFGMVDGRSINWLTRPLPDGATLAVFADMTANNSLERVLREKAEALSEADRLKTAFLEKVSYQLRTPLTTIAGYTEIIEKGIAGHLNPMQRDYISAISDASAQLENMVGDLLDLAVINAGQEPLDLSEVDVFDVLDKTASIAKAKVSDAEVNIKIDCDQNIGFIIADDKKIRQIMFNLLNDAMEHSCRREEIIIGAKRIDKSIKLFVTSSNNSDTQFGHFIFDSFNDNSKQVGFGPVLVRKFVEMHNGWIAAKFSDDNKTTVICHFPATPINLPHQEPLELLAS